MTIGPLDAEKGRAKSMDRNSSLPEQADALFNDGYDFRGFFSLQGFMGHGVGAHFNHEFLLPGKIEKVSDLSISPAAQGVIRREDRQRGAEQGDFFDEFP